MNPVDLSTGRYSDRNIAKYLVIPMTTYDYARSRKQRVFLIVHQEDVDRMKRNLKSIRSASCLLPEGATIGYKFGKAIITEGRIRDEARNDDNFDESLYSAAQRLRDQLIAIRDPQELEISYDVLLYLYTSICSMYVTFGPGAEVLRASADSTKIDRDIIARLLDTGEVAVSSPPSDALDYPVEVRKLPSQLGGGYIACIPYLDPYLFQADGNTPQEALEHLQQVYEELTRNVLTGQFPAPPESHYQETE